MANVCVITGGGSGIGLEAAKCMPKDRIIIISGRTEEKLAKGVEELRSLGYTAFAKACDTSKRASVRELVTFALTATFVYLAVNKDIEPQIFMTIYTMVIGFYFGTQHEKNNREKEEEK